LISRVEQVEQLCSGLRSLSRSSDRQRAELELRHILDSEQFRGSNRSCKFLQYVVEKALAGEFEALKERILGIELFARQSTFDTDHDSVVRVAANDVRRRLKEYYRIHPDTALRIDLPAGVYIPQIEVMPDRPVAPAEAAPASSAPAPWRRIALISALAALVLALFFWQPALQPVSQPLPWSALLKPGKVIDIIPADANLVIAKVRARQDIPIETYNDHSFSYAGDLTGAFGAYLNHIPLTTVSDAVLAGRISDLATRAGARAQVKACNRVDFSELKGEVPVVLLGSPMSNPWVQLLYDQLNFQVVHHFEDGFDVCVNRHPKPGELAVYVPTLNRQGFSEGYAIVTLVPNLTAKAPVLIIAGTSTEGTEAAGDFVTNLDRVAESLKKLGIVPQSSLRRIELVIKTSFVNSASATYEIVAWRAS
jgi:hypothetical protein